ncbi:MAG: hypothetical protein RIQ57_941 [Pseudomonadota bacterium]
MKKIYINKNPLDSQNLTHPFFFTMTSDHLNLFSIKNKKGPVLGLDLGIKKTGVAIGNNELKTSENLTTITAKNKDERLKKIKEIVDQWQPIYIVIGLPTNQDDSMSAVSRFCLNTGKEIKNKLNIPVVFINENYSSTEAEGFIENHLNLNLRKNNDLIDQLSAEIILQTHFNEIDSLNSTEKI